VYSVRAWLDWVNFRCIGLDLLTLRYIDRPPSIAKLSVAPDAVAVSILGPGLLQCSVGDRQSE
jgi:hypothetical protein